MYEPGNRITPELDHVAVDGDGDLAELLHAHDAAQASADEALNLHAAALARAVLALRPARRRRGEHGVLGGDPTAAVARAAPLGHPLLDGRAAQDARVAELGEARPGGGLDHVVGELDRPHLVHGAAKAALAMLVGRGHGLLASLQRNPGAALAGRGRLCMVGDERFELPALCV